MKRLNPLKRTRDEMEIECTVSVGGVNRYVGGGTDIHEFLG